MKTNPKQAFGDKKAPISCVPAPVMLEIGLAMLEGAIKYGRHNYRETPVQASTYYDACLRHMMQWWEGEDIDVDSDLSHITKAIASLVVLRDAMMINKFIDDRPPTHDPSWIKEMNEKTVKLKARLLPVGSLVDIIR